MRGSASPRWAGPTLPETLRFRSASADRQRNRRQSGLESSIPNLSQGATAVSIPSPLSRSLCRGSIRRGGASVLSEPARRRAAPKPRKRILFASAHSIVDFSNGASIATLDMLEGLADSGFSCQAFCAAKLDFSRRLAWTRSSIRCMSRTRIEPSVCGSQRANVMYTRRRHVPVTIIRLESTRHVYDGPRRSHGPGVLPQVPRRLPA